MRIVRALNWKYALGELAIVVVGILLAVQIDRWNQARQDAEATQEYLERLEADLSADLEGLAAFRGELAMKWALADSLAARLEWERPPPGFADLANRLRRTNFFSVQAGTYRELVSSGRLGLLPSAIQRDLIAYYDARSTIDPELRSLVRGLFWDRLTVFYDRHVSPRSLTLGPAAAPYRDPVRFTTSWEAFRTDPEALLLFHGAWSLAHSLDPVYAGIEAEVEELREAVRAGMNR